MTRTTGAWCRMAASLGTITVWLLWPQSGEAQADAEALAGLRACGGVARDRDRLACFDRALAAEHAEVPAAGVAEPLGADRAEPLAAERAEGTAAVPAPPPAAAVEERSVSSSFGATANAASADPVAAQPADDLLAREADDPVDQPRVVRIVDINAAVPGAARFLTEGGQLIVQTSGGTPRGGYPDVPFDARLEGGAFGSLFLAVDERRRVRVKLSD